MLTIVTGPPAGGKSTHVREHAEPGDLVVDLDEIASALTAGGSGHEHGRLVWRAAQRARAAAVEEALRHADGHAVWIIHTDPDQDAMARYRDHDARVVVCDPGRDEVARRIAGERPASAQAAADRWYASRSEDQRDGRAQSAGTPTVLEDRMTEINPTPAAPAAPAEKTFTQADVERIIGERLARERDKFADYDQLKAKAAEADSSKSELQKLAERVEAAEKKAAEQEAKALRAEVASAKGLTAAQAKRLTGSTKEELESDADDLLEAFGGKKTEPDPPEPKDEPAADPKQAPEPAAGRPRERLTPGAAPAAEPGKDPAKLAESILKSPF